MKRKPPAAGSAPRKPQWTPLADAALPAAVLSASGRLLHSNAGLRELLGWSAKELRTLRWADLTHPEFSSTRDQHQTSRS